MPGDEDVKSSSTATSPHAKVPATWSERSAQREHNNALKAQAAPLPPVPVPFRSERDPIVRVHIEELGEQVSRPELLSSPPGRTMLNISGPPGVVGATLRKMGNKLDPPWWMFWAHLRRS